MHRAFLKCLVGFLATVSSALRVTEYTNPFQNVLLIVYCRLAPWQVRKMPNLCKKRANLYKGYEKHFARTLFMGEEECKYAPSSSHRCLTKIIKGQAAGYDGVFYMSFDTPFSVERLRPIFDKKSLADFGADRKCWINGDHLLRNCTWNGWSAARAIRYRRAFDELVDADYGVRRGWAPMVWLGNDDLFYIPRNLYSLYVNMTRILVKHDVHREIVGPTVRRLMVKLKAAPYQSLHCNSSCCEAAGGRSGLALSRDFQCGRIPALAEDDAADDIISDAVSDVNATQVRRLEGGSNETHGERSAINATPAGVNSTLLGAASLTRVDDQAVRLQRLMDELTF
mmetsp:Transcript_50023/g.116107  ORF Transcript_50023/g.116107 Transcript_50023/m.116107 type:complete len:340 (-) Transcript_50023:127-1146(-)